MNDRFLLPQVIHGVAGEEMNIYFSNVYATLNPANYAFHFHCKCGICCEERWHFTPTAEEIGTYSARLEIFDDNGLVTSGETTIIIHDPVNFLGVKLHLLMIGDSLTDQSHYPTHIHTLCRRFGIELEMLGTNVPEILRNRPGQVIRYPEPELLPGVRHEGYGGWTAKAFLSRREIPENPRHHWECPSPFLNAQGEFDFGGYISKHCSGKVPDVIMIGLGTNDLGNITEENYNETLNSFLKNMTLLQEKLREAAPCAVMGIVLNPYGSSSQTAWGKNYGSRRFRWEKRQLHAKAYREIAKLFEKRENTFLVPLYQAVDPVYGYPCEECKAFAESDTMLLQPCNALHPSPAGYRQMGSAAFSWLLDVMERLPLVFIDPPPDIFNTEFDFSSK